MNEKYNVIRITGTDVSIAVAVVFSLLVCYIAGKCGFQIQTLSACTSAVMCVQDSRKASWCAEVNRILGIICGGAAGIAVVAADNIIQIELIFYILMGTGVVVTLLLCKLVKLPFVQARVSCMTLMLVTSCCKVGDGSTMRLVDCKDLS